MDYYLQGDDTVNVAKELRLLRKRHQMAVSSSRKHFLTVTYSKILTRSVIEKDFFLLLKD